jgi:hypothetical protein
MRNRFTYHTDAGHGWLAVREQDAGDVGLSTSDFSRYSFQKANWLYLEEDCDMAKFMEAYKAKCGAFPQLANMHCNGNSSIRRYRRIAA